MKIHDSLDFEVKVQKATNILEGRLETQIYFSN